METPVTLAIITGCVTVATAALTVLNTYLVSRVRDSVKESAETIQTLEKNTNSMKDALVKVTGEAAFAKGLKAGTEAAAESPSNTRE